MNFKVILVIFVICSIGAVTSSVDAEPYSASAVRKTVFKRKKVEQEFRRNFYKQVCVPTNHFLSCFKIGSGTCRKTVNNAVEACLVKHRLPQKINGEQLIKKGAEIGKCIGKVYHRRLNKYFVKVPKCMAPQKAASL